MADQPHDAHGPNTRRGRIAVLAFGNPAEGDDGAASVALAQLCSRWQLPAEVVALDFGTPGAYLADQLRGFEAVVALDTLWVAQQAGTVLVERDPSRLRSAPHDPSLVDALDELALAGQAPADVVVVGVVPAHLGSGTALSEPVAGAISPLVATVVAELGRLGAAPALRPEPVLSDLWWARADAADHAVAVRS
jgi:hydrogenase maturation protease